MRASRLLAVLLFATGLSAQRLENKNWLDTEAKIEMGVALGSLAADGYTTVWNGGSTTKDFNFILGNHSGDVGRVTSYFTATAGGLVYGNYVLRNHRVMRRVLNLSVSAMEGYWVSYNVSHHRR